MKKEYNISGIQQAGVGVSNVHEAWKWYYKYFGADVRVFEDKAEANLMQTYTGGQPRQRHAALAVNLQGGGGFEIWQYTCRTPQPAAFDIKVGDLGLYAVKIKCKNIEETYKHFTENGQKVTSIEKGVDGKNTFFVYDPYGNVFQLVESTNWFKNENKLTGLVYGVVIGVKNIEKSLVVYSDILGYDKVVSDKSGQFDDLKLLNGGNCSFRRVLLTHSKPRMGAFSRLFGDSFIELIEVKDTEPRKIFENRFWGDLGFIHLCFDINNMANLREYCTSKGFPFTADSERGLDGKIFDMGEASGSFSYIADPDGALIEFVETHRVPIAKKFGLYLNLSKRNPLKPLPNIIVKALGLNRVKF